MSRFYFNIASNGERIPDEQGVQLSAADIEQLADTIREVWQEEPELFDVDDAWRIEVVDDEGRLLGVFRIAAMSKAEAVAAAVALRRKVTKS